MDEITINITLTIAFMILGYWGGYYFLNKKMPIKFNTRLNIVYLYCGYVLNLFWSNIINAFKGTNETMVGINRILLAIISISVIYFTLKNLVFKQNKASFRLIKLFGWLGILKAWTYYSIAINMIPLVKEWFNFLGTYELIFAIIVLSVIRKNYKPYKKKNDITTTI